MAGEENWRERYLALSRDHEAAQGQRRDAEHLLTRTIARLCVAAGGLDPVLDPHLERLRSAVRKGYTPALQEQLGELADAVVSVGEARRKGDLPGRLIDRLDLPGRQGAKAKAAWARLAENPEAAGAAQLDEFLALLGLARPTVAPEGGKGLFGRLFHGSEPPPPNRVVGELLGRIEWPATLAPDLQGLQGTLAAATDPGAWTGVLEQLGALVAKALSGAEQEAQVAQSFLTDLTERLQAIDAHFRGERALRDRARSSADRLGDMMRREVGGLSNSVHRSSDLGQLRQAVLSSLDRIQTQVDQHLEAEEGLRREAEARESELGSALEKLEREAFDLRRQVSRTQDLALRDTLTGLPNRRAYDARMAQEFARWRRFGEPLVLLLWDVDNFKQVNDTYGHKAGDRALQLIAEVLGRRVRETDFLARHGGEEFALLLVGAHLEQALKVAEVMRAAVAGAGLHSNNRPVPITVSGGLAQFREGDTPEGVFERADQALYAAKRAGKDRCQTA